ncbi:UvrD-helicase domain-containing protein [Aerococcus sp. UMB7834]|uniref:UvrD-helicase domain-containing protein n=1 Tax=Aerococcus sp. UMB7834 TaxID=3046342 RepID=UPI002550C1E5|nr:UvrD-helicase domain-containing protein [Aerococcus sp. UMB7834]MDK6804958.1 3'-5' exonuclease [Aerococcus sp. UMB7834]
MASREDLIQGLNDKQKEAVQCTEGPLLIMAGAGSGKTRVLTHRMAYILSEKDVRPWNLLAITFTNKAAKEMRERVDQLIGQGAEAMWVATFHSMCVRILRREAEAIGLSRSFTIADPAEQQTLIKQVMKDLNIDTTKFKPRMILGKISDAKNNLQTPDQYADRHSGLIEDIVAKCYAAYQKQLLAAQSLDFDDLIMYTVRLFEEQKEVLRYYQQKFQYIHVDEYQDTNEAQYRLVKLLADYFKNICVVGDADQSIYGWRGANMENILNFEEDYPEAKVVLLEQNYRSTKTILAAANDVIGRNQKRKEKDLWTDNDQGEKIHYYRAQTEQDESYFVIEEIKKALQKNYQYKDIAVLYRTNAQSRVVEENLVKANLPYRIVGGLKFYDRKEIKDILAYLRLLANPQDNLSFTRVVNVPKRGVGPGSLDKLRQFASDQGLTLLQAAGHVDYAPISGKAAKSLKNFAQMLADLNQERAELSIRQLTEKVLDQSGYQEDLENQKTLEAQTRLENIQEFLSVADEFDKRWQEEAGNRQVAAEADDQGQPVQVEAIQLPEGPGPSAQKQEVISLFGDDTLDRLLDEEDLMVPELEEDRLLAFLTDLSLVADTGEEEESTSGQVTLMTLHAAKGLEFPIVFMIGMEEGLFPLSRAAQDPDELEEERRLAYVGITRAEEKLYLSNSYSRMLYGKREAHAPSRFIEEIDAEHLDQSAKQATSFSFDFGQGQATTAGSYCNYLKGKRQERAGAQTYYDRQAKEAKRSVFDKPQSQSESSEQETAWRVGDKAQHKKWGLGTVVKVTGEGNDQELDIAFKAQGIKRLLAAFAPIEKV